MLCLSLKGISFTLPFDLNKKDSMKILMVLENVFPQDERVEKEIASLMGSGHDVRIATYSFKNTGFEERYMGYTIYRKKLSTLYYKFGAAILVFPFYFNFWRRYLDSIYTTWNFDAIHIHDLPLAKLGYEYKKKKGIRFVADQHEFYSNWIVKTAHYNTFLGRIIKILSNWPRYEKKYLGEADLVCTVEEPLRKLYISDRGIDPEKVVVIPNTPLKSIYSVASRDVLKKEYTLFYCGGLDILRGLDVPIQAMQILKEDIPEINLVLVGKTNKHFDPLARAAELGVQSMVNFRGWVDYQDLPHEIDQSDICFFIPPANRDEINNTIATKIYQYMARGKPVIVGSARYMKNFVEELDIGLVVDENSKESFAEAVLKIYSNPDLSKRFTTNALNHIESYFWDKTVESMIRFYKRQE